MDLTTLPPDSGSKALRRARALRRTGLVVLAAIVLAGGTGLLGPRTGVAIADGGGYRLRVEYPRVSRGGLAASWRVAVTSPAGFRAPLTIRTTARYFDLFDQNTVTPSPAAATVEHDLLVWTFDPPAGETLVVSMDARIEPARQWGHGATTSVSAEGRIVAEVSYSTIVMP